MNDRNRHEGHGDSRARRRGLVIAGALATAALGLGCNESGSCGGAGALDGVYASADPSVSMTVLECDGEVSGSLTIAGVTYDLEGTRTDDEFEWSTSSEDLCDRLGYRRVLYSQSANPFVVDQWADSFSGSFRMRDVNCSSGRAFSRGFTTTFDRI